MTFDWQTLYLALRLCGINMDAKDAQYLHSIIEVLSNKGDDMTVHDAAALEILHYHQTEEE